MKLKPTPIKGSQLYKNECGRLVGRITPYKLLVELNKVYRAGVKMALGEPDDMFPIKISGSFVWMGTPQGHAFWHKLDNPDFLGKLNMP